MAIRLIANDNLPKRLRLLLAGGVFFLLGVPAAQAHGEKDRLAAETAVPVMDFVPPAPGTYALPPIMRAADGPVLDAHGRQRKLSEFTSGKVTLLTFMYTSCADAGGCPYALYVFQQVKRSVEQDARLRGRVRLVSVSFDPLRDTPEVLAGQQTFLAGRQGAVAWDFLTTASLRELLPLLDGYGQDVAIELDEKSGKPTGFYNHVLKVFLIDKARRVREIYTTAYLLPAVVLNDIKTLLMEEGPVPR
ncbi:SCO family protein [Pelomicrobium sp.]|mgnify:CR=1 FL=1|jgi:cytochrome oxidase Cu insertion factor (SCO1/SenC/PrrC family)|uniref:SCO family protein n=1 Tax=Pelomicrobium sp. TaxID=2815319 RepID=UPI002FDD50AA